MFARTQRAWRRYCQWLDDLGFTEENRRCCVPLDERAQQALKRGNEERPTGEPEKPGADR